MTLDSTLLLSDPVDPRRRLGFLLAEKFEFGTVIYTFNDDGTCIARTNNGEMKGTWRVEQDKFVARWNHGFTDTYDLPSKDGVFNGVNQIGDKLVMYKSAR